MVVAVDVVERINAVVTGLKASYYELAELVGASDAFKRQCSYCGVGEVAVDTHEHILRRLKSASLENHTGYSQRVDRVAGREVDCKSVERVALVQVLYRVGKVDGIGGIVQHRVTQFGRDTFAVCRNRRDVLLRRRHYDLVHHILHLHILVKVDGDVILLEVNRADSGVALYVNRRVDIVFASGRTAH